MRLCTLLVALVFCTTTAVAYEQPKALYAFDGDNDHAYTTLCHGSFEGYRRTHFVAFVWTSPGEGMIPVFHGFVQGMNLWTTSAQELINLGIPNPQPAYYIFPPTAPSEGLLPLYRLYNGDRDHIYVSTDDRKNTYMKIGYKNDEGLMGFVSASGDQCPDAPGWDNPQVICEDAEIFGRCQGSTPLCTSKCSPGKEYWACKSDIYDGACNR